MPNGEHGARAAFAGYLYQITGALGLTARVSSDDHGDANELTALIEVTRTGELHHERLGQDLVLATLGIEQADHLVLVQFKYSQQHPIPTIGPEELRAIADRMLASRANALQQGAEVIGFALITNRLLGPGSQGLIDAAKAEAAPAQAADEPRWEVFRTLRAITELQQGEWETDLDRFARSYGCLQDEIVQGRNALVGDLLQRAAQGLNSVVRKEELVRAFTGYQDTKPLTWSSLRAEVSSRIANFPAHSPGDPLRRQVQDDIRQAASERALVVVHGYGGCGKTVGLKQWAVDMSQPVSPQHGRFAVIQVARGLPNPWLAKLVSEWQQVPADNPRRNDLNDVALLRLHRANPDGAQPLLCLALDALDEELGPADQFVRDEIAWFWEEDDLSRREGRLPRATMVVSVRDAADIDQIWLARNPSGFEYVGDKPSAIHVGDFSLDELREAAETAVPNIANRISGGIALLGVGQGLEPALPAGVPLDLPALDAQQPASPTVVQALRHPVMWGSLLQLEAAHQGAVLDGDEVALRLLAERFLRRFHNKVSARGRIANLEMEALRAVLVAIAHQTHEAGGEAHLVRQWVDAVTSTGLLTQFDAQVLFREAMQAGVVRRDDLVHWRWRHSFVADYLMWEHAHVQ
jgi:hypothetical protein